MGDVGALYLHTAIPAESQAMLQVACASFRRNARRVFRDDHAALDVVDDNGELRRVQVPEEGDE